MRTFFAALGSILLFGCSATGSIPVVTTQAALDVTEGSDAKPLLLSRVVIKLHRGDDVGKQMGGLFCKTRGRLIWRAGRADIGNEELAQTFQEVLKQSNYPVVGDPDALFDDAGASQAELKVAGQIDKLEIDACYPDDNSQNYEYAKGGAYIHVNWQIYDVLTRKVVYEVSTEGAYKNDSTSTYGIPTFITGAFDIAVRNLVANQGFHDLVMRKRNAQSTSTELPPIQLRAATTPPTGVSDARAGTVTVITSTGHGSGFIISPDGYVLTNQHVVEQAHVVKVRLASGRDVIGEVLRTDAARDVALIRLAESNLPALNLRLATAPEVADEVFAIGTPLDLALDTTVTRGIVSAYRNDGGFKFIQCDVAVTHGNSGGPLLDKSGAVVGLTEKGLHPDQTGSLNLFIPIDDAIRHLKIRFSPETASSSHMQ